MHNQIEIDYVYVCVNRCKNEIKTEIDRVCLCGSLLRQSETHTHRNEKKVK